MHNSIQNSVLLNMCLSSLQGTKRRASLDSDNLGPPAKVQKRNDHVAEKEADAQESSSEVVADGDDSDSQLNLASQPSQSEPDVVLSSPGDKPGGVAVEQDKGERLKSAESGGVTAEQHEGEPLKSGDVAAERDEGKPLKSAKSGGVTAERDEGESLKSEEIIDSDDDNVFVEKIRRPLVQMMKITSSAVRVKQLLWRVLKKMRWLSELTVPWTQVTTVQL